MYPIIGLALLTTLASLTQGQRITTIQLEGVQYFVSRMNPYSPELNWFLAYQYCRSIGLQLTSFETKEKADYFMEYLRNAGYSKYDFWTSGNRLGTDMFLWMSTGLPFNVTFNYMKEGADSDLTHGPQPFTRKKRGDSGASNGCVALKKPDLQWDTDDCTAVKDFICEQTRCYYYNYGSIPVSTAQGRSQKMRKSSVPPFSSSSLSPASSTSSSIGTSSTHYYSSSPVSTRKISTPSSTTTSSSPTTTTTTTRRELPSTSSPPSSAIPSSTYRNTETYPTTIIYEHVPKVYEENSEQEDSETAGSIAGAGTGSINTDYQQSQSHYVTTSDSSEEYNTHPETAVEQTTMMIHEETNELQSLRDSLAMSGSRNLQHDLEDPFPWPWARNIMLERPVNRKVSE